MYGTKRSVIYVLTVFLVAALMVPAAQAKEGSKVTLNQVMQAKSFYDDPRPLFKELPFKQVEPPDAYAKLTYDEEAMKKTWSEVVGFEATDLVGKIAPEIKPGKYNYKDKEKYPGLKELMIPNYYERFKPGEPPFYGNFSEIEIVPARQYYYALPIAEATKKYAGTVKQDDQGYIIEDSYVAGLPFPKPSGPHKSMQVLYNWDYRYFDSENNSIIAINKGLDSKLAEDFDSVAYIWQLKLNARLTMPPYGWYDKRAQERGEKGGFIYYSLSPRDQYGNIVNVTKFLGLSDFDQFLLYIAQLRRVRKLSGTDTQDIAVGMDTIYEDSEGFSQKLTPDRFPYKYEIIAEREYLMPAYSEDGAEYTRSKSCEIGNIRFERRPCYVLQLTQLDKNFVYGKRIIYMDAETFIMHRIENYDQKGRLYRDYDSIDRWYPEMGNFDLFFVSGHDYLDIHNSAAFYYGIPSPWLTRDDISMRSMITKGK